MDKPMNKTAQTRTIEEMLKAGRSLSVIAHSVGVSWQRVRQIKKAMQDEIMAGNALARKIAREDLNRKYNEHVKNINRRGKVKR